MDNQQTMTLMEALQTRHSIRKYERRPIEEGTLRLLRGEIARLNRAGGLNMQLVTDEPRAFRSLLAYGMFAGVTNYVMVIGRKAPDLDLRAGYYTERLVLRARQLGLDTCIVGLTYKKIKGTVTVAEDEKIVVCVAIGYGAAPGRRHKIRRPEEVSNVGAGTPEWFARGVDAALLAPTAVNQQKFHFGYVAPAAEGGVPGVRATTRPSLAGYTKVDLGIAMCNFEIGAAPARFTWLGEYKP